MYSTLRPTSRPWEGVSIHAHGDLPGDSRVVTPWELSPGEAASSRQVARGKESVFMLMGIFQGIPAS